MTLHEEARRDYLDILEDVASVRYQLATDTVRGGERGELWRAKAEFALAKYLRELQAVEWAKEPCRCTGM